MAILTGTFQSHELMRNVSFTAIIPTAAHSLRDPDSSGQHKNPLKTLYLLHGWNGNHEDWIQSTQIVQWALEYNIAVIMPSGENSFYVDHPSDEHYGKFIGKELVEETRKLFPLSSRREDTFIGGLSMGGYGSLRNGYYYNETFSKIIALSSRVLQKNYPYHDLTEANPIHKRLFYIIGSKNFEDMSDDIDIYSLVKQCSTTPDLFLACGTEDYLYEENRDLHLWLEDQSIDHVYTEAPGEHNWDFWKDIIKEALEWLVEK